MSTTEQLTVQGIDGVVTRHAGHPWDGDQRPNFDLLEFRADSVERRDAFVVALSRKHWQPWLVGTEDGTERPAAVLYKPSGIDHPWEDTGSNRHPGGIDPADTRADQPSLSP